MMGSVAELAKKVPDCCHTTQCNRDQCSVRLNGTPTNRLIIDMDCEALEMTTETRCDYLFVSEDDDTTWVAPIELKGGKAGSVSRVANQLRRGTTLAAELLPESLAIQFVPVLAHKKSIHKVDLKKLRKEKIRLRNNVGMIRIVKCGTPLVKALRL